jgi:hypothetical protein
LNVVLYADSPKKILINTVQLTELQELRNTDVLIGMDIISLGDFAITNLNGIPWFSFRVPSAAHIDFVPETNLHNRRLQMQASRGGSKRKSKKKKS